MITPWKSSTARQRLHRQVVEQAEQAALPDDQAPPVQLRLSSPSATSLENLDNQLQALVAALTLGLLQQGWELHSEPGELYLVNATQQRCDPVLVINGLLKGKLDAESWKRQCAEMGIAGRSLAELAGVADAPSH